jgi:hypothetical protein
MQPTAEQLVAALAGDGYKEAINSWLYQPKDGPAHPSDGDMPLPVALDSLQISLCESPTASPQSLLCLAVISGNTKAVDYLVQQVGRAVIDQQDINGLTSAHYAALLSTPDMLGCLLDYSADPFLVDKNKLTLLHYAAISNNLAMVLYLIDIDAWEADIQLLSARDDFNRTPYDYTRFLFIVIGSIEFKLFRDIDLRISEFFKDFWCITSVLKRYCNATPASWLCTKVSDGRVQANAEIMAHLGREMLELKCSLAGRRQAGQTPESNLDKDTAMEDYTPPTLR